MYSIGVEMNTIVFEVGPIPLEHVVTVVFEFILSFCVPSLPALVVMRTFNLG